MELHPTDQTSIPPPHRWSFTLPVKAAVWAHIGDLGCLLVAEDLGGLHVVLIDVHTQDHILHLGHRLGDTHDGRHILLDLKHTVRGVLHVGKQCLKHYNILTDTHTHKGTHSPLHWAGLSVQSDPAGPAGVQVGATDGDACAPIHWPIVGVHLRHVRNLGARGIM